MTPIGEKAEMSILNFKLLSHEKNILLLDRNGRLVGFVSVFLFCV